MTAIEHPPSYRGYVPRPLAPDLRLFHGYMYTIPLVDREDFARLEASFEEPFVGITTDGTPRHGLFTPDPTGQSTAAIVEAALGFLDSLQSEDQRKYARQPFNSEHRRRWTNAFTTWMPAGLLLDDLDESQREAAISVVRESMSEAGFAEARAMMQLNAALGDFIGMYQDTLREWTYFFTIFGEPSTTEPWGWQLMGHHLDLNCLVLGDQVTLSPVFMGAEIGDFDEGPMAGYHAFADEAQQGLDLIRALSEAQQAKAILYRSMLTADLPPELNGRVDGRHRAGAGRDNLVLPYEGIAASELDGPQADLLLRLIGTYVGRVAVGEAAYEMDRARRHLDETWFAWIGDPDTDGPFYYRVHSPVVLIEFDHHAGIFLTADEPQPFHVHTIVRFPNGGDYGMELLRARES